MYDLSGKTAIVTGCASSKGIGHALALRLAREGADVGVTDLCSAGDENDKNRQGLLELKSEIEKLGRKAVAVCADITDAEQVGTMVDTVVSELGGVHILCNNAGAAFGMNLSYMISPSDWRKMLEVNLTGTFIVSAAVAKVMTKQNRGGSIINTASWRGRYPAPFMAAYCAAKAGVMALTEVMALELSANNIRVNAICPGKVDTEMERMGWQLKADAFGKDIDDIRKEEESHVPLKRIALPEDIANLVAFLASEQSSYCTGQILYITGGMTLVNPR